MALNPTDIQKAYVAFFNRPADVAGLTYWSTYAGNSSDLLNTFAKSAEYNALYSGLNNTQLVNAIYQNLFGRSPEPTGLTYWVKELDTGKVTIGNAANTIQTAAQGSDKTTIDNKVVAATAFTTALDTTAEIVGYAGASSALQGQVKAWLSSVTDSAASLTAAQASLGALTDTVASGAGGSTTGQTFTLTTGQDTFNGNAGADILRAVAGAQIGNQDQTTLNSSDVLDGAAGEDLLVVNLTGPQYIGGATIKNIETLQVGLNVATSIFDYNVNQGVYEVTGVNTIVADQVNANEDLTFNNILKTGDNIPTLHWRNEAGSVAGEVDYNHRASAVAGTTTEQKVILDNVSASLTAQANSGVLNIGAGVETLNITSQGSGKNTLNPHETQQTANAVGTFVDLASGAAGLTKVVVSGAAAFGEDANVITQTADANYGLTNRLVGADDGLSDARSSASNLVSLANSVTEYDASAATGAQSVRFTPNANINTGVNVTFKGGSAADYVEFELGNVTAAGNAGDDTFAFINGTNNSSFTSTDTINGGDGVDTFQIGLNGNVQTYNISATEFNNKTSIEVVDLRGSNNTVNLSQEFVDAAQQKLTVRTDRAVQTSDTDTANDMTNTPAANLLREDGMVTVLDTTNLNQNTGLKYLGGSGSDRLILDNESFNQFVELDGGTNMGQGVVATAGDYDTLTVRDSAVLDRGDLANVKGFEGIILVKSQSAAQTDITLTEAFLLANTKVNDLDVAYGETDIRDQTFFIGTSRAANSNALTAGDTVNVDITDLLNGAAIKTSLTGRGVDLTSLVAAGVTVNYIVNGVAATAAQIAAVTQNDAAVNVASVIGASPAIPAANLGNTLTAQAVGFNTTTGFMLTGGNGTNLATTLADTLNTSAANIAGSTINLAAGVDTLNITTATAGGELSAGGVVVAGVENLVLQAGGTLLAADTALGFTSITANAASTVTLSGGQTFTGSAAADTITTSAAGDIVFGNGGNDTVTSGGGNDQITTVGGNDTINIGAGNQTVVTGAGSDTVNVILSGSDTVNLGAADAAVDTVNIVNAAVVAANTDLVTITNFSTANDVISTLVGGTSTSNGVFINEATGVGAPAVTALATGTILEISSASYQYAGAAPNEAALLAHMTGTMGVTGAASALITVVVYDGSGNAAILQAQETGAALGAFDAIELVGVVQGVTANSFSAVNFA